MKVFFILAANDRSLSYLWPGKIDTIDRKAFTNTSSLPHYKPIKKNSLFANTNIQLILYTCLCFTLAFLIIKRLMVKRKQ